MQQCDCKFEQIVHTNEMVLFMRGSSSCPLCGKGANVYHLLQRVEFPCKTVDLSQDPLLCAYLNEKHHPVLDPYLYANGKYIGNYETIIAMLNAGILTFQNFLPINAY